MIGMDKMERVHQYATQITNGLRGIDHKNQLQVHYVGFISYQKLRTDGISILKNRSNHMKLELRGMWLQPDAWTVTTIPESRIYSSL